MDNNKLSLLMLHNYFVDYVKMERARERGKTQTMEGTVITEREVRNKRAIINDIILVGMCSEHHYH